MPGSTVILGFFARLGGSGAGAPKPQSGPSLFGKLLHDPGVVAGALVLGLILGGALAAPLLAGADPYHTSILLRLKPPFYRGHLMGTDDLGRDMLARLLYGGRTTLITGFVPVIVATGIGGTLGLLAGFCGGRINMLIMRVMDVFYAFPSVLLAVALAGALGGGTKNAILSLTLVFIAPLCRVAESAATEVRHLDFVAAARASGASPWRVLRFHVIGHVVGPVLVYASGMCSLSIVLAAGLSFLGLGVRPPEPDWGLMLSALRQTVYINPVVAALPGALIFLTSLALNMVSDGVRDAMAVKS
jgi:peptide/nickel transport system permease protein